MIEDTRRIVTGHDENGTSVVVIDGPPGNRLAKGARGLVQLWQTDGKALDRRDGADIVPDRLTLYPPAGGTKLLFVAIGPDDPGLTSEELEEQAADGFAAMDASDARVNTRRHPRMHETKTVDYIILLQGEVTLLLDGDSRDLRPFDVVIQRGTNHAWICKGEEPALLAAVLIDANFR
ncbi:MAG: cupin domain-containing protein [Kiloniellaceae bacterium]